MPKELYLAILPANLSQKDQSGFKNALWSNCMNTFCYVAMQFANSLFIQHLCCTHGLHRNIHNANIKRAAFKIINKEKYDD